MGVVAAALEELLELVAPRRCPGCDLSVTGSESGPWCGACGPLIERAPAHCAPPARVSAGFVYGGPMADAIGLFKYGPRPELARSLGALLATLAAPYGGEVDAVMPVPLHRRRLRARGFNQSALLAAPVARALGVPLITRRLVRTRHTAPQVGLSAAARADNVRGAFSARGDSAGLHVLLVDDVQTTGATLAAAGRALEAAGAGGVFTLVLAGAEAGAER